MRAVPRKDRNGKIYYSFIYTDPTTGKRIRLKKEDAPLFDNLEAAEQWASSQAAYQSSLRALSKKRQEWRTKYYKFDELIPPFVAWHRKKAPRSWEDSERFVRTYILYFFLGIKDANNPNVWQTMFGQFKTWLEDEATTLKGKKLSYSTQNHILKTLNLFLTFLVDQGLMDPQAKATCPLHSSDKIGSRSLKDVVFPDEFKSVHGKLSKINPLAADFYWICYHTGMRFNELFSLPFRAIFKGEMTGALHDELTLHKIKYQGYIVLESQVAEPTRPRNPDFTHNRIPLKGRKIIHPKYFRHIPIIEIKTWNILARLYQGQKKLHDKKTFGDDKTNYVLFEDLTYNEARNSLKVTYEKLGLPEKTHHCLRHSYSTFMIGRTRSFFISKMVLGHFTETSFNKYNHIAELIAQQQKQDSQEIEELPEEEASKEEENDESA